MKKIMFVAAVAASMVAFGDITSANVVGYKGFGDGTWLTQAGAAFSPINATGTWVNETTLFGQDVAGGDTVLKFSSDVWDLNTWTFNGFDEQEQSKGWGYAYTDPETWEPGSMVVQSFETKQGDTITFRPADGVSGLTIAGQVTDMSKPATWTLPAGEWIGDIMNPYPVPTTFADLETFAVPGDTLLVFNPNVWDLDSFVFNGAGLGWAVSTMNTETWEPLQYVETDTTKVVLPTGIGGCLRPVDMDGRTWTVDLTK